MGKLFKEFIPKFKDMDINDVYCWVCANAIVADEILRRLIVTKL